MSFSEAGVWTGIAAASQAVWGEFVANYGTDQGQSYQEAIATFLSPVIKNPEVARVVAWTIPLAAIGLMAVIRIKPRELLQILFNKERVEDLTEAEKKELKQNLDDLQMHNQAKKVSARDLKIKASDESHTSSKGKAGKETRGKKKGETKRNLPPHAHDEEGNHLPW